jgi:guanylate kinase
LRRKPEAALSVSVTTRPARRGERQGADYFFVSEQEFAAMRDRGDLLEWAEVYGHYYGTPRKPVEEAMQLGRDVVLELDIQGATAIKRVIPDAVLVFIEPPSLDDLVLRLRGRGTEDPLTLSQRVRSAYGEVKNKGVYDHIVVNDNIDAAVQQLVRILNGR